MFRGRILQVFNRYVQQGGEESFVTQLQTIIGSEQIQSVSSTAGLDGPNAPPKWSKRF